MILQRLGGNRYRVLLRYNDLEKTREGYTKPDHDYYKKEIVNGKVRYYYTREQWEKAQAGTRPPNLKKYIHTILHGTDEEKEKLHKKHLYIADTPKFMKELKNPIKGKHFTARYGVIAHHKNKSDDHNLTEAEQVELCDAIRKPFAITVHKDGHNLFTEVKHNEKYVMVGIVSKGRKTIINAVGTVFEANSIKGDEVIYIAKNITPEQALLLGKTNFANSQSGVTDSTVSQYRK